MGKRERELTEEQLEDILDVPHDESDRACAVLGAAYLDFLLGKVLVRAMTRGEEVADRLLYKVDAPAGTLSARIGLAYGLGLIDEESRDDLHRIRDLRNDFAHDLETHSFSQNDSIRDRCKNLKRGTRFADRYSEPHRSNLRRPRNLFIVTVVDLQLRVAAGATEKRPDRVLMVKTLEDDAS